MWIPNLRRLDFTDGLSPYRLNANVSNDHQVSYSEDEAIGSVLIDEAFQRKVEERLRLIPGEHGIFRMVESVANEMVRGRFQDIKHEFGTTQVKTFKTFNLRVPDLSNDFTDEKAGIEYGRMVFNQ